VFRCWNAGLQPAVCHLRRAEPGVGLEVCERAALVILDTCLPAKQRVWRGQIEVAKVFPVTIGVLLQFLSKTYMG
jgi:hypothetical protein